MSKEFFVNKMTLKGVILLVVAILVSMWRLMEPHPPGEHLDISFHPQHPENFRAAKASLVDLFPVGKSLYCGCEYSTLSEKQVNVQNCGFKPKNFRGRRIEWEHVVPASIFGRHFTAWSRGHPECRKKNGNHFRGRRCARKVSETFRRMEADLYNLMPAIGELNQARSNFSFGFVTGEPRVYGNCDFEVFKQVVEPRSEIRGDLARVYFYMQARYPGFKIISAKERPTLERWAKEDPLDGQERQRLMEIERIQGNSFFIGPLSHHKNGKLAMQHRDGD